MKHVLCVVGSLLLVVFLFFLMLYYILLSMVSGILLLLYGISTGEAPEGSSAVEYAPQDEPIQSMGDAIPFRADIVFLEQPIDRTLPSPPSRNG